jgi:cardiolipin synthase
VRVMAGGTNIAEEYIGPTPRSDRWQDLSFLLEGPNASVYQQIFESDWQFAAGEQEIPELTLPAIESGKGQIVQVVPAGPDVAEDPLYDAFITAFYTAQERLWIVTPYFVPDQALMQSIETASHRGVDVRILVPKVSNQGLANLARGPYLRQLRDAGATIMQYTPGMMHAKILLVDHQFAMVGSCNLDLRSLLLNYEVAMFTYSPEGIADVEEWVTGLMHDCEIGIADPSSTRDFFENLTALISPLL